MSRHQGQNEAGRIRSIEKSNMLIGNPTRDLPACNIMPQPITLPRAPLKILLHVHQLLANVLVNKFPRRQILGTQPVARLRNNR
jgi:hypothetical protein